MARHRSFRSFGNAIRSWSNRVRDVVAPDANDVAAMIVMEEIVTGPYQVLTGNSRRTWRIHTGSAGDYFEPYGAVDFTIPDPRSSWTGSRRAPAGVARIVYNNAFHTFFSQEAGGFHAVAHHHISAAGRRAATRINQPANVSIAFAEEA